MNRWRNSIAALFLSGAVLAASAVSADTLAPGEDPGPINWQSGNSPNEEAFVLSGDMTGLVFLAGCDVMDGVDPYLALGAMKFVTAREKKRLFGFSREPNDGLSLTVSGVTSDGPFSFSTQDAGWYGGTSIFELQSVDYVGGGVTPAQLQLLMRAKSITVVARGVEHPFSAHGSARAIRRLSCAGA